MVLEEPLGLGSERTNTHTNCCELEGSLPVEGAGTACSLYSKIVLIHLDRRPPGMFHRCVWVFVWATCVFGWLHAFNGSITVMQHFSSLLHFDPLLCVCFLSHLFNGIVCVCVFGPCACVLPPNLPACLPRARESLCLLRLSAPRR